LATDDAVWGDEASAGRIGESCARPCCAEATKLASSNNANPSLALGRNIKLRDERDVGSYPGMLILTLNDEKGCCAGKIHLGA
jgi:hypothetical protein